MSLFRDSMRPPPLTSDAAVRRYLEAIRSQLEPDPLFRHRLRGATLNRFVAAREGLIPASARPSAMGRLGRACLYASVVVAMSVSGVMAASQGSIPGDVLYPVKRQIEAMRMQVLPSEFRDELAAYVLAARVNELGQLAERGAWDEVEAHTVAVEESYQALQALSSDEAGSDALEARLSVLESIIAHLPDQAQEVVERAMGGDVGADPDAPGVGEGSSTNGGTNSGGSSDGGSNNGGSNNGGSNNGGSNNGGAGDEDNGGTNNGGSNNGGSSNGDANVGGTNSGGTSSGGANNDDGNAPPASPSAGGASGDPPRQSPAPGGSGGSGPGPASPAATPSG